MASGNSKTLIYGAIIGALAGVAAAYIYLQKAGEYDEAPSLNAADSVKIGLGVLGLLKLVADTSESRQ